jgi:formylglycine-generating enzyme required for sulfatase activity
MTRTERCAVTPVLLALCGALALLPAACQRLGPSGGPAADVQVTQTKGGEMVLIPAGEFQMGGNHKDDQNPVHTVHVDAFLMDRAPVTQAQWIRLKEAIGIPEGSHFKGPDRPVEMVSWAGAARYCNARSEDEGLEPCYDVDTAKCDSKKNGYRLPTEAEWEYACRAGAAGDYFFGGDARRLGDYAWYEGNAAKETHPVGQKKPNPWGLFDMYGNVAQWCNDVYAADYYGRSPKDNPRGPDAGDKYVLRGGAWNLKADAIGSPYRRYDTPGTADACFARDAIGFRCVRKAPPSQIAQK